MNLYGSYIIKNFILEEPDSEVNLSLLVNQINPKYLSLMVNLLSKKNKKLSYIIIWILISISSIDFNEELFIKDKNIIYKISKFLGEVKNDKVLTYSGIYLLRNITFNNNNIKEILLNYNIFEYCYEIYQKYFLFDNDFSHNIFKCLGNFTYEPNKKFIKQYLIFITMIKPYLNTKTEIKKLNKYITYIYNLCCLDVEVFCGEILKQNIYKNFIDIYPFNAHNEIWDNLRILILKILGKLLSLDEEKYSFKKLIDYGLINFIDKIISSCENKNDYILLKNILFCINNLSLNNITYINLLYINEIYKKMINIGNELYKLIKGNSNKINKNTYSSFRELCYSFSLMIINLSYKNLLPLVQRDNNIIIICIIEALNIFEKNENLIFLCIKALYRLVKYDKILEEFDYNNIINDLNCNFVEIMERNGIKYSLDDYIFDKRNDICQAANDLNNIINS